MMIGESTLPRSNPTVQIPHWDPLDDNISNHIQNSPYVIDSPPSSLTALHRYLPSNDAVDFPLTGDEFDDFHVSDAFSCDHFRMFEFKVRKCARGRSHDWTECPYAHPGEKARRRDPRKYHYSGTACPDFRKGGCKHGDACEFAHGVFECWLHPARYRTQPCKDGVACTRRVCFFAHTPDQLRILPGSCELEFGSSPLRHHFDSYLTKTGAPYVSSPTSILASPPVSPPSESPPMSPSGGVSDLVASMRGLQLSRMKSFPLAWGMLSGSSRFGSPRSSFCSSLPSTPTRTVARPGLCHVDLWDTPGFEVLPAMERVESGRDMRARMYEKLSKENCQSG